MDISTAIIEWVGKYWLPLFVIYWLISGAISNMDAPTKDSGTFYRWFFKYMNWIVANWKRGAGAALEKSPNWKDAIAKVVDGGIICPKCGEKIFNGSQTSNGGTNVKT